MKVITPWTMELVTIYSMSVLVLLLWFQSIGWGAKGQDIEEKIWKVRAANGAEILLGKNRYYMGNRLWDDVYIKTKGRKKRYRIYLNVQKDQILITVLRGSIVVDQKRYGTNYRRKIRVSEFSDVRIDGTEEIMFRRLKEGREAWRS